MFVPYEINLGNRGVTFLGLYFGVEQLTKHHSTNSTVHQENHLSKFFSLIITLLRFPIQWEILKQKSVNS